MSRRFRFKTAQMSNASNIFSFLRNQDAAKWLCVILRFLSNGYFGLLFYFDPKNSKELFLRKRLISFFFCINKTEIYVWEVLFFCTSMPIWEESVEKKIIEISQILVTSWLTIYFLMTFGSSRPFMGAKKAPLNSSWKTESGRRLFEHPQITSKFDLTWPDLHLIECVFTLTPNVIEVAPKLLVVCPHYILWAK